MCDVCVVNTDGRENTNVLFHWVRAGSSVFWTLGFWALSSSPMADFNLLLLGVIKYNLHKKVFGEFCESF